MKFPQSSQFFSQPRTFMKTIWLTRLRLLLFLGVVTSSLAAFAPLEIHDLRVDDINSPLGVDSAVPHFSWKLSAPSHQRGARQTAWQVRAGSKSAEAADVWDSGRIESGDPLNIAYAGRPLHSHEKIFWQSRVWDESGHASDWSTPASFTIGVLGAADWQPAHWITASALLKWQRTKLGFSSEETENPATTKWVQLDLGSPQAIDTVRLYPVRHTVVENLGFAQQFKLEFSDDAAFLLPVVVVDSTEADFGTSWSRLTEIPAFGVRARYVRFTATKLPVEAGKARLAFSQIEIISRGRNIAIGATVTASDKLEDAQWSAASVVDGLGIPDTNPHANETLRLRREFTVRPNLRRAILHLSGLGHYALSLNGVQPDLGLLTPGWTDTEKTVLYDTHDITALLHAGANVASLELAGGMYNVQSGRYTKFVTPFRPLIALAQLRLEYADGSTDQIVTDSQWRTSAGPITFANIYGGEDYDARREQRGWNQIGFDDHTWSPAVEAAGPGGKLRGVSQASPAFGNFETLKPIKITTLRPGVSVYDLGQNASLMLHARWRGPAGSQIKIIPAELIFSDGSVDCSSSSSGGGASWNYTFGENDGDVEWRPQFFYHGARYLQVERTPAQPGAALPEVESLEGIVTHSASPAIGEFACSDDLFNRINTLVRWAQASNLAHVITDCPHRERLGWLEQYHLNGPALRYGWDLGRLYKKGFDDMADAQRADGLVPSIAPEFVKFSGGFRDSAEWGSSLILAAWQQYVWTGDDTPLREHYDAMRRYFDYLGTTAKNHLINHGLGDWYDIGPKKPGRSQLTPIALTATAIYYDDAITLAQIARRLGRETAALAYLTQAAKIKAAFNEAFFHPDTGRYATGSQTAQAMPLVFGLVPDGKRDAVIAALTSEIENGGNALTAGDVGYRYLLSALADAGRSDLIFAINHQSEKPGYGYQLAHGATSLTEAWDASRESSQNHFMLGQIVEWFYGDLAGLTPDPESAGFGRVIIQPQPVAGIDWARVRYESPRGPIAIEWRRAGGRFTLSVDLPPNVTALVILPGKPGEAVLEGGRPVEKASGINQAAGQPGRFAIQSGHYEFQTADVAAP